MPYSLLGLALLLAVGALALRGAQASRVRRLSLERIGLQIQEELPASALAMDETPPIRAYPPRYRWAPALAGLFAAAWVFWGTDLPKAYSLSTGILIAVIAALLEVHWAGKKVEQMESQLADAIDMIAASLRAGSALLGSLEASLREARQPIRAELENIIARIRVGEDPRSVVRELALRVPLESFRLFSHSLLVHWETGGSLAASLRTVGSTVRDRIEVSRRISAQAVESQVSVAVIMGVTYGLTFFMLRTNPEQVRKLLYSDIGSFIAAALMIMHAVGIVWIWRMSRIRF
jgi:Flp pilus assembly protein TadB